MKKNKTLIAAIILIVIVIGTYLIIDYYDGKKIDNARNLFRQVRPGMTKQQVVDILGEPDTVFYNTNPTSLEFEYFTKETKSILSSGTPTIIFDSNGVVKGTSFDF